jgi:hypothetical protein
MLFAHSLDRLTTRGQRPQIETHAQAETDRLAAPRLGRSRRARTNPRLTVNVGYRTFGLP